MEENGRKKVDWNYPETVKVVNILSLIIMIIISGAVGIAAATAGAVRSSHENCIFFIGSRALLTTKTRWQLANDF